MRISLCMSTYVCMYVSCVLCLCVCLFVYVCVCVDLPWLSRSWMCLSSHQPRRGGKKFMDCQYKRENHTALLLLLLPLSLPIPLTLPPTPHQHTHTHTQEQIWGVWRSIFSVNLIKVQTRVYRKTWLISDSYVHMYVDIYIHKFRGVCEWQARVYISVCVSASM